MKKAVRIVYTVICVAAVVADSAGLTQRARQTEPAPAPEVEAAVPVFAETEEPALPRAVTREETAIETYAELLALGVAEPAERLAYETLARCAGSGLYDCSTTEEGFVFRREAAGAALARIFAAPAPDNPAPTASDPPPRVLGDVLLLPAPEDRIALSQARSYRTERAGRGYGAPSTRTGITAAARSYSSPKAGASPRRS